ncbi:MAG: sulfatase-like hydrolase/transferase [Acidobacteria bacterium]|nr:sulfatase-like hydrolase/transferase [Acidobacteriota bacterium]
MSSSRFSVLRGSAFLFVVVVVAAAAVFVLRGRKAQADLRPIANQNVLLITIDTLRADALGSYGGQAATPALDSLAAGGVRFDFAHAHAVLTLPSHTSILTGRYPFQHGVRDNSGYRLAPDARTAATVLKRAGYATAAFVAAFPLHSRFGLNQGFDVYDDRFGETRAPTEFVMPERPATAVVALAREWLASQHGRSFTWVHVFDPHAPYRPPPPYDAQYASRPYYGEVAATDAALAPLLDDVRRSAKPALVIVTGDHGEALGDHGEDTHGIFAYESTLRIPLIIAELGGTGPPEGGRHDTLASDETRGVRLQPDQAGEVSSVAARHVDILPTILDAIGQAIPGDLPGRSLLPAGERRGSPAPRPSYFEAMAGTLNRGWAPLTGVLADRDKYIDVPIVERYDLTADPAEASNLAGRAPARDRALAASLRAFQSELPGQRRPEDPDAAARLRALGYVSGDAPIKARYTEADDPKTLVGLDQEIHRGVDLFVAKRFADAVQVYEGVIGRRPDMAIAYRHLAFVQWESGNVAAAIGVLEKARAAGVAHGGITTQLGAYLAETGRAAEAVRLLQPVATAAAPDVDALNALGIAYGRSGHAAEARAVFERMLSLNPESAMALENLGTLDLERNDLRGAAKRFADAVRVDPFSSQAQAGVGVVSLKTGDRRGAIAAWTRAVELDATNYDAMYNLAMTLLRDNQTAAARPYLERFLHSAPEAFYEKDLREVAAMLQRLPQDAREKR